MVNELGELLTAMSSLEKRIESLEIKEKELRQRTLDTIYIVRDVSEQLLKLVSKLS